VTPSQPATARPWAVRWLLLLVAVAGLGLGTGSHCDDHASAAPSAAQSPATVVSPLDHWHLADSDHGPAGTADQCRPASPAATAIVAGAAVHLPALVRMVPRVASLPYPPQPGRRRPAVTLAQIGISRT
jgi:hypothetical protein